MLYSTNKIYCVSLNKGLNGYYLPFKCPISRSRSATLLFEAINTDVKREGDEIMRSEIARVKRIITMNQ